MPSITVNLPKEMGGATTINLREGESPDQAINRRIASIKGHQVGQDKATFMEGMGAGFMDIGRSVGNMVGMVDDETVMNQREIDEGLGGMGKFGKFAGEMLATAPLGGGVGAGVAKGARALDAASKGGKYLTKTLGRGMGRGAVEGATYGAVMADPNERGAGALGGAAFGGALGAAGTALGKALGKGSVTKITDEAKQLQKLTGTFIPLSQAAEEGMTRMIYNAFLANIPGVGGKIRGQYKNALQDARRFAAEHAMPDTPSAHEAVKLTGRESIDEMIQKMKQYWGSEAEGIKGIAFEGIKNLPIIIGKGMKVPVAPKWLISKVDDITEGMVTFPAPGKQMTGAQILDLKTAIGSVIAKLEPKTAGVARAYTKQLDELMKANWDPTGKGRGAAARALREYQDASKYYKSWMALRSSADKAADLSEFGMSQLAKSAKAGTGRVLPGRASVGQEARSRVNPLATQRRTGQLGVKALENFPSKQGLFQTLAATSPATSALGGAALGGMGGALAAFPIVVGLGRLGASKSVQKYLSGQTKFQKLTRTRRRRWTSELMKLGLNRKQAERLLDAPGSAATQAAILGESNAT